MLKARESDQNVHSDVQYLDPYIQEALEKRLCVNCERKLGTGGYLYIEYVVCSNGKVVWWHTHRCYRKKLKKLDK